jgi:Tol biopolymer transport system component
MRSSSSLVAALSLCAALAGCGGGGSDSETPPPGITPLGTNILVFDSDRTGNHEIYLMRNDGGATAQVTSDTSYENWWPRISPDRRKLLFYRAPRGNSERYDLASLWVVNVDGSGLTRLRAAGTDGWALQGHGEWSPDGSSIAMFGGSATSPQIFITDSLGRFPRQLTARAGVNTDVSWSPDGRTILFNGCPSTPCTPADYEIYAMPSAGGAETRLTFDHLADYDPYFSPDGTKIAWLTNSNPSAWSGAGAWGISLANADGSNPVWLIDDGNINSKPAWSLDGRSIYFHRMEPLVATRWGVYRMASDGTGLTALTATSTANNEFPSN